MKNNLEKTNMKNFPNNKKMKTIHIVVYTVLILLVGYLSNNFYQNLRCNHTFKFIEQECRDIVVEKGNYLKLKIALQDYFETEKTEGKLFDASVYFRDLNDGPVMGINEGDKFTSASLLKLPIVMTVLDMAENNPEILDTKIANNPENKINLSQYFVPDKKIQDGVSYSIREVIEYALTYSDNTAIKMLQDFIYSYSHEKREILVFTELGLILPNDDLDRDISTRAYASLFRLLYNSSYLSRDYSDMVLQDLSRSYFRLGLRAGVPENVVVAHKFGERFEEGLKQLHDCGIIYYPQNPYMLCVMTMGNNYDDLAKIIQEVSKKVYEEVDSRKI